MSTARAIIEAEDPKEVFRHVTEAEDPKEVFRRTVATGWAAKPIDDGVARHAVTLFFNGEEQHNVIIADGKQFAPELAAYLNWLTAKLPYDETARKCWIPDFYIHKADLARLPEQYVRETGKPAFKRAGKTGLRRSTDPNEPRTEPPGQVWASMGEAEDPKDFLLNKAKHIPTKVFEITWYDNQGRLHYTSFQHVFSGDDAVECLKRNLQRGPGAHYLPIEIEAVREIPRRLGEAEDPKRFLQQHGRDFKYTRGNAGVLFYVVPLSQRAIDFCKTLMLPHRWSTTGQMNMPLHYAEQFLAQAGAEGITGHELKESEDPKDVFKKATRWHRDWRVTWERPNGQRFKALIRTKSGTRKEAEAECERYYWEFDPKIVFVEPVGESKAVREAEDPKAFLRQVSAKLHAYRKGMRVRIVNAIENFADAGQEGRVIDVRGAGDAQACEVMLYEPRYQSTMQPVPVSNLVPVGPDRPWTEAEDPKDIFRKAIDAGPDMLLRQELQRLGFKLVKPRVGDDTEEIWKAKRGRVVHTVRQSEAQGGWHYSRNTVPDYNHMTGPTNMVRSLRRYVESKADDIAKEAAKAEAPKSPEEAEAGTYKKGHIRLHGWEISIENAKGSVRKSKDPENPWQVTLPAHYGYICGTVGHDKDRLDVYIGEQPTSMLAYVVNQHKEKGGFDEHKIMLGFKTKDEAIACYDAAFNGDLGPKLRHSVVSATIDQLKAWLEKGDTKKEFVHLEEAEENFHPGFKAVRDDEEIEWRYDAKAYGYRFSKWWNDDYTHKRREALNIGFSHQTHFSLNKEMERWKAGGWTVTPLGVQQEAEDPKGVFRRAVGPVPFSELPVGAKCQLPPQPDEQRSRRERSTFEKTGPKQAQRVGGYKVLKPKAGLKVYRVSEGEDPKEFFRQMPRSVWSYHVKWSPDRTKSHVYITHDGKVVNDYELGLWDEENGDHDPNALGKYWVDWYKRLDAICPYRPEEWKSATGHFTHQKGFNSWYEKAYGLRHKRQVGEHKSGARRVIEAEDPKDFFKSRMPRPQLPQNIVKITVRQREAEGVDAAYYTTRVPVTWVKARVMTGEGWVAGIELDRGTRGPFMLTPDQWLETLEMVEYSIMEGPPEPSGFHDEYEDDWPITEVEWVFVGDYLRDQERATQFFGGIVPHRD